MGGITGYAGGQLGGYLQAPLSSIYGNVASPVLREMLMQGSVGIATGFTLNTAMAKINGASWGDALSSGVNGATWGAVTGFASGALTGFRTAYKEGYDPYSGKPKYQFKLNESEGATQIYDVAYDSKKFLIGGEMEMNNKVLSIKGFDIDGGSTNQLGVKGVREFTNSFGKYMKANEVHIYGAKRTTGANPGKLSIYRQKIK